MGDFLPSFLPTSLPAYHPSDEARTLAAQVADEDEAAAMVASPVLRMEGSLARLGVSGREGVESSVSVLSGREDGWVY